MARIVEVVGSSVKVIFDGEDVASEKLYPRLKSYSPDVGERVFMKYFKGSYIALGAV